MTGLTGEREQKTATIGKVLSPHGVAGWVKVFPLTDFPERCYELGEVFLEREGRPLSMVVEKSSLYGRFWLLKLKGVETREQAARLSGSLITIPKRERVPLPEGRYYYDQVVGLQVYSVAGELLGEVVDILSTGGHDLFVVRGKDGGALPGKEILIPAVHRFVREIDLDRGRMTVELPEGLVEL